MPVDPWGGTNQGLANLGATFDDLNTRSRQRMLDARALAAHQDELDRRAREEARLERAEARQAKLDALDEPYKKARNAEAEITLDNQRRAAARLKDYETEYAALGNGPVSTLEAVPNPNYAPPRAATPLSAIANRTRANALAVASEGDPGAMAVDTSMLPTGQTAAVGSPVAMKPGTRPMSDAEQMGQRIALAIKHRRYDELGGMGTAYDISDKLQTAEGRKFTEVMGKISSIRDQYGPDVAKELAPQIAQGYGIKPDTFEGIDFDAGGGIFKQAPDGEWYHLSNDGKSFHKLTPNNGKQFAPPSMVQLPGGKTVYGQFEINPDGSRGQFHRIDSQSPASITLNMPSTDDIESMVDKLARGEMAPSYIPARGPVRAKVIARLEQKYPGTNLAQMEAAAAYEKNSQAMNTKTLLNSIDPLFQKLETAGEALGNTRIPGVNRVMNWVKEETGDPDIVAFNNLRDDTVAELERGLLGTGVLSDSKYFRALKNLNSAQNMAQLRAAIKNTRAVIAARLEAVAAGPYGKPKAATPPTAPKKVGKYTVEVE